VSCPILLEPTPGYRRWGFHHSRWSPGFFHTYSFGSPKRWITDCPAKLERPYLVAHPIQTFPVQDRVTPRYV
jgi:hypothetical protein